MGSGVPRLAIVPDLLYVTCPMITFQLLNIEGYHFIKGLMDDSSRFPIEWWGNMLAPKIYYSSSDIE